MIIWGENHIVSIELIISFLHKAITQNCTVKLKVNQKQTELTSHPQRTARKILGVEKKSSRKKNRASLMTAKRAKHRASLMTVKRKRAKKP